MTSNLTKGHKGFRVYVVGNENGLNKMFSQKVGFEVVSRYQNADIIAFPGGADINPSLYGEEAIKQTSYSDFFDKRDEGIYNELRDEQLKVGICRGGQFLNVMNGGKMWQHVTNHTVTHTLVDFALTKTEFPVISTHHQMMIMGEDGELLAAAKNQSDVFCSAKYPEGIPKEFHPKWEPEVIYYKKTNSLCFQPHPEYYQNSTRNYFFDLLDHVL